MSRDVFFIAPVREDLPGSPAEVVLAVADFLKAAGYKLTTARESAYLFDKIKQAIEEKGITHFTGTVNLLEGVLPDNTPREELVDTLRYMIRNIRANRELLLIDPYLFPDNADAGYMPYLDKVFGNAIGNIARLDIATLPNADPSTRTAFVKMATKRKPGLAVGIKYTKVFHDRFWIADRARGVFIGTSLNGIGRRYSLADYLRDEDVKEVYARYAALP